MEYICSNCGSSLSNDAKFCSECGTKIERELKCSNCGARLAENAKFCIECGTKVETQEYIQHIKEVIMKSESPIINKIPSDVDLSNSIIDVNFILENIPNIINEISTKVLVYNDKAIRQGYSLFSLNNETKALKGCFSPKTVEGNSSNYVTGFITGLKHGWKESELRNDFLNICRLCESIAKESNVKIEEVVTNIEDVSVSSPLMFVNKTLPFSKEYDKNENGIDISETSFGVEYHLLSNLSVIEKIEKQYDKYNKSAIRYGYKPLLFNRDTLEFKGLYEPRKVTDDMGTFKRMHIIALNACHCSDLIRLCKLCETIMDKSNN